MKIYNCYSKEVKETHLKENPLKENWIRHYYDCTDRNYKDYSPQEWEEITNPNKTTNFLERIYVWNGILHN